MHPVLVFLLIELG